MYDFFLQRRALWFSGYLFSDRNRKILLFFFSLLLSGQRINSDDGSVESIVFQSRSSDLNEKMSAVAANGLPVGRIAERPANLDNI